MLHACAQNEKLCEAADHHLSDVAEIARGELISVKQFSGVVAVCGISVA